MIVSKTTATTSRSGGRIVLIVFGSIFGLLAIALLAGGGILVWAHETKRDAAGYYATSAKPLATPTYALVSDGLDIGTGVPDAIFRRGRLGTIRVAATGTSRHAIFVGVARTARVEAYLRAVAHDEVTEFEIDPFSVSYGRRAGQSSPALPSDQAFWAVKSSGTGRQSLTWPVEKGSWAVVVMNADAARGVRAEVSVGAKLAFLLWLGIGLLASGAVPIVGAGVAVRFGWRRPQRLPIAL